MFTVSVTQCSLEQVGSEQHKLQEAQQHLERQECVRADELLGLEPVRRLQTAYFPDDCSVPVLHTPGFFWGLWGWP